VSIKLAFVYIIECFCTGSHAKGIGAIEINVIIHVALLGTPPNFFYTFALYLENIINQIGKPGQELYHSEEKKGTSECTYSVPETHPPFTIFGFQYFITETTVKEIYKLLFHNIKNFRIRQE
jgi:hypothetical protein